MTQALYAHMNNKKKKTKKYKIQRFMKPPKPMTRLGGKELYKTHENWQKYLLA
jgi:hypothetical protein